MLVLVRHGQSLANAEGRLVGRLDSPLTELGRRQAEATAGLVVGAAERGGRPITRLVSSPLGRARDSAAALAGACASSAVPAPAVEIDDRAIELDYGQLDGLRLGEVPAEVWKAWQDDPAWRPEGGESLVEVGVRFRSLLEELAPPAESGDVVIVSHVSPIKAGVAWALGVGVETSWRMSLGVASVTRLLVSPRGPSLLSFGETPHLDV